MEFELLLNEFTIDSAENKAYLYLEEEVLVFKIPKNYLEKVEAKAIKEHLVFEELDTENSELDNKENYNLGKSLFYSTNNVKSHKKSTYSSNKYSNNINYNRNNQELNKYSNNINYNKNDEIIKGDKLTYL